MTQNVHLKLNAGLPLQKQHLTRRRLLSLKKKMYGRIIKWNFLSTAFYGAENCAPRKVDHKYLKIPEMWSWRRMEKIICTDSRLKNEERLKEVKEGRNILHTIKRRGRTGLSHVIERKIEGTGRRGRKCKQLHYDLEEKREFCKLKEEAIDRMCGEVGLEEAVDLSE
jgi:hypothetical protein